MQLVRLGRQAGGVLRVGITKGEGRNPMTKRVSAMPELVFLPNHAGYGDDEEARLRDFLHGCRKGRLESWTCKKTAGCGDVYLYWFSHPSSQLAGIGVSSGEISPEENDGWDWTDAEKGWFCEFEPLVALRTPVTLEDIHDDRILTAWWKGRPFQGRPKQIVQASVARRLSELILQKNSKDKGLARILGRFSRATL
jgi:hypothetical protein